MGAADEENVEAVCPQFCALFYKQPEHTEAVLIGGIRMKRYCVTFTQNWSYTVEAESEDEAEALAYKEFQSEMRRSVSNTCYDYYETECLDPDDNED